MSITLRDMDNFDVLLISNWLQNESEYMSDGMMPCNTKIWEDKGFYSFSIKKFVPYLEHLYIVPKERNFKNAIRLFKDYVEFIKKIGFTATIISARKEYLKRLIEMKFKVKPYDVINDLSYYLVEV